jgi:drug/metabolite transporter (DMT)-like permease
MSGELAAVAAALAFSGASTLFTLAGRRLGPELTLRAGLSVSTLLLALVHWLTVGTLLPEHVEGFRWFWLILSGVFGFWLAFVLLMHAFVRIGPRLSLLIASITPILSALFGWIFLNEALDTVSLIGIALTIAGVVWVVMDKSENMPETRPADFRVGVLFAVIGAVLQAFSFLFSREGVEGDFNSLTGSLIRISVAVLGMWGFALFRGQLANSVQRLREAPQAVRQMSAAAVLGPAAGATLVLLSLQHAPVGVASTLTNLTPIFLIPIGYIVFHERITPHALVGTLVAMVGTALLFL